MRRICLPMRLFVATKGMHNNTELICSIYATTMKASIKFVSIDFIICVVILAFAGSVSVQCWWDKGHMLVAAIAKLNMSSRDIAIIESYLSKWDYLYPGLGDIVTAAVWSDHIKCRPEDYFCQGLEKVDYLDIFNQFHYTSIAYNPTNMTLDIKYQILPMNNTGAVFILEKIYNGFKHTVLSKYGITKGGQVHDLSDFGINFKIRMALHIMGDLHQPLHAVMLFTPHLPNGDAGGNDLLVNILKEHRIISLHQLWDSIATNSNFWPYLKVDKILEEAKELLAKYPVSELPEKLEVRNSDDFFLFARESYDLAIKYVYPEINFQTVRQWDPFELSEEYYKKLVNVCEKQIVIAGYRLASLLKEIASVLGTADIFDDIIS